MKAAIISPWAINQNSIGGTERFTIDLAEALSSAGHTSTVYMFSGTTHRVNNITYQNIDLFNTTQPVDEYLIKQQLGDFGTPTSFSRLAARIESQLNLDDYDVVYLNSQLLLSAYTDRKRIFIIHTNPYEHKLAWGNQSFKTMLSLMSQFANDPNTIFVAPSEYYAKKYHQLTSCGVSHIPHAIEPKRLQTPLSKIEIAQKYQLDPGKFNLVVPSRLEPIQKRPMLVVDACLDLKPELKNKLQIIFTGLDSQYEKFMDDILSKGRTHHLNIKIRRFNSISEAYKLASLIVLPSRSESFGYSALESLSLNIPTILSDIPTFNEIAKHNPSAIIFDQTTTDLKAKIEQQISSTTPAIRTQPPADWQRTYNLDTFAKNYLSL